MTNAVAERRKRKKKKMKKRRKKKPRKVKRKSYTHTRTQPLCKCVRVTSNLLSWKPLPSHHHQHHHHHRYPTLLVCTYICTLSPSKPLTKITHLKNVHVSLRGPGPVSIRTLVSPAVLSAISSNVSHTPEPGTEFTLLFDCKYFTYAQTAICFEYNAYSHTLV